MSPLPNNYAFISYSRIDTEVMLRIVSHLRTQGITSWVDNEKLVPGTPVWEREIEKAIDGASAVVVVLSPDAKESVWVLTELTLADEFKKRVFPVLVRGEFRDAIPFRLVTRQFVDLRANETRGLESLSEALIHYLEAIGQTENKSRPPESAPERPENKKPITNKTGAEQIANPTPDKNRQLMKETQLANVPEAKQPHLRKIEERKNTQTSVPIKTGIEIYCTQKYYSSWNYKPVCIFRASSSNRSNQVELVWGGASYIPLDPEINYEITIQVPMLIGAFGKATFSCRVKRGQIARCEYNAPLTTAGDGKVKRH